MTSEHFIFRSPMPASAKALFAWHCRPGAFERLCPPWEPVKVLERKGGVEKGGRVVLAVRAGGFWRRWTAEHRDYEQDRQFCDVQTEGPFARWRHCHRVVSDGPDRSTLEDHIEYALPFGRVGSLLGGALVRRKLERMFRYRHRITANDLSLHRRYASGRRLKIGITGSSGLVGSALVPFLTAGGHEVTRIVRRAGAPPGMRFPGIRSRARSTSAVWKVSMRWFTLPAKVWPGDDGTRGKKPEFATVGCKAPGCSAKHWQGCASLPGCLSAPRRSVFTAIKVIAN